MSSLRLHPALMLAIVSSGWAAGPVAPPELNGILVTGKDHRFALVGSGGGYFHWASLGETVDGWKLVDYISSDDSLVLNRDGQEVTVRLRASTVSQADAGSSIQATVATADEVLTKMKFEAMWDRIAGEQKRAIIGGMHQQATAEFTKMGLPQAEIDTLLEKMGTPSWPVCNPKRCARTSPASSRKSTRRTNYEAWPIFTTPPRAKPGRKNNPRCSRS